MNKLYAVSLMLGLGSSAFATITIATVMLFGWFAQRQLIRGLTFGAVK